MTATYLQETYLLQEPGDHEVVKHDRAHHRNYNSNNSHPRDPQESSRIRRLLTPFRPPTADRDPDIHTELPFKSPNRFLNHPASAAGNSDGLDVQILPKSPRQPSLTSRPSRSVSGRRLAERRTPDKDPGGGKFSIKRAAKEVGSGSQPAAEESLENKNIQPGTSPLSNRGGSKTELDQSNFSPPALESYLRKPRLSLSKTLIQNVFSGSKPSPLSRASNINAPSEITLCSALESETHSEIGPITSLVESPQDSSLSNHLRESTLESKTNLTGPSSLWLPADLLPHEYSALEAQPISRTDAAARTQESSRTALDQSWFTRTRGERYHPHARGDVPYWMSYQPEVINHHILMQYASAILQGSSPFELTFSPSAASNSTNGIRRVLDIGCGPSATWCVGVLRETSSVEVTGLDICPLLLDLGSLERSSSEKFSFVKHDFLDDALPFDTASFDYVHASFISAGVPEHKLPYLLEEMARVLKRHGTLEILDCNTPVADPIKGKAPDHLDIESKQGASFCRVPTATASNIALGSTSRESKCLMQPRSQVGPTTVNGMINKLLEQQFISPYPLSLLPTEVSNVTTGLRRPLAKQSIRFPSDLQTFVDIQTKSPDRATLTKSGSQKLRASDDPRVKAAAAECMGMLLLHSHIAATCSNKEIIWCDLWLPSISSEASTSMPATSVKRTRTSTSRVHSNFGRHFHQSGRNKLISTTRKSKSNHYEPTGTEANVESHNGSNSKKSLSIPREGSLTLQEKFYSMSHLNLNSTAFAGSSNVDLPLDQKHPDQHQYEHEKINCNTPRHSSSEICTHRKNFDQIWDMWRDDLNCHSLGISKLLELRFGWTCSLDIEKQKALTQHREFYQHELSQCDFRINELRHKLQERKSAHATEVEASLHEDPHRTTLPGVNRTAPHYTHGSLSFEYETSSEGNEEFEHANFPKGLPDFSAHVTGTSADPRQLLASLENLATSYGNNAVHHETDSQSLEELGCDTHREDPSFRQEIINDPISHTSHSSGNTGHLSSSALDGRSTHIKFIPAPEQAESEDMNDRLVSLKLCLSSSQISSDHTSTKQQENEANLEVEIDNLTRQKAEIKKAIQHIQTDLDNVTKRLGPSDREDHQLFGILSTTPSQHHRQAMSVEKHEGDMSAIKKDEAGITRKMIIGEKERGSGTLGELFSPLDKLEFSNFMSHERLKSTSALGESIPNKNCMQADKHFSSRLPTFNRSIPSRKLNPSNQPSKNTKDSKFTNAGFGDLKVEKFYSFKKN